MLILMLLITAIIAMAMAGLIALVCLGIGREEADYSLRFGPATRTSALARRIVGLHGTFHR
jgi:hypothetical protein